MKYQCICDIGCVRNNNEDIAYADGRIVRNGTIQGECDPPAAFAVADGMGGYEGGEIASEIVVRSFSGFMKKFSESNDASEKYAIKKWASAANQLVLDTASIRSELSEMGTTFVAIIFMKGKAWLINIGDSRCYLFRNGAMRQLTTDHSERERTGDPDTPSNLIFNYMGNIPSDFFADISLLCPIPGDIYLLCSDGLSDLIDDETLGINIQNLDQLIELAKEKGGRDNITAISISI